MLPTRPQPRWLPLFQWPIDRSGSGQRSRYPTQAHMLMTRLMSDMQFSIRFLLTLTAIIAILVYCFAFLSQATFLISCVPIPSALALTCRYTLSRDHVNSSLVAFGSAVLIGATMMAWGSYDQTFNKGAVGFLVGGGWSSVAASAIFGALAGAFCGVVSIMLYLITALGMDYQLQAKRNSTPDNQVVNPSRR